MRVRRFQGEVAADTGAGNTPVDFTSNALIDWLGYSSKDSEGIGQLWPGASIPWVADARGGRYGYQNMYRWGKAEAWTGGPGGGGHVDLSGAACRDLEEAAALEVEGWNWGDHLAWVEGNGWGVSRLDMSLDLMGGDVAVEEFAACMRAGQIVTKWKEESWLEMKGIGPGVQGGHTVYLGSVKSDARLLIYDKKRERGQSDDAPNWVRVEMRCRHEVAKAMARRIAGGGLLAGIAGLASYVDFLTPQGTRLPTWENALGKVDPRPLAVYQRGGTVTSMRRWLDEQVAPALALIEYLDGGDLAYLEALVTEGRKRWNAKHRSIKATYDQQQIQEPGSHD